MPPGYGSARNEADPGVAALRHDRSRQRTGYSARTIRYYVTQEFSNPPRAAGRLSHLFERTTPPPADDRGTESPGDTCRSTEIRERLEKLSTSDLEAHFAIGHVRSRAAGDRTFAPGLELHVRENDGTQLQFERDVDQIIKYARFPLEQLKDLS